MHCIGAKRRAQPDLGISDLECARLRRGAAPATGRSIRDRVAATGRERGNGAGERLRASIECRDAAIAPRDYAGTLERAKHWMPGEWLALLAGLDALRRPERLRVLWRACAGRFLKREIGRCRRPRRQARLLQAPSARSIP
jgi:hypothetical protein